MSRLSAHSCVVANDDVPAGWYPDPDDNGASQRYWSGDDWTEQTRPSTRPRPQASSPSTSTATGEHRDYSTAGSGYSGPHNSGSQQSQQWGPPPPGNWGGPPPGNWGGPPPNQPWGTP